MLCCFFKGLFQLQNHNTVAIATGTKQRLLDSVCACTCEDYARYAAGTSEGSRKSL